MKVNILHIVYAHFLTLKSNGSRRISFEDIFVFILIPLVLSILMGFQGIKFHRDSYNVSVSVFAIFAALLLNVQVALFGILQRDWRKTFDKNIDENLNLKIKERRSLLGEINTHIAYLVLVSCICVSIFLIFHIFDKHWAVETYISTFLYVHFLLTLLMVIKRSYAVFQKEYEIE